MIKRKNRMANDCCRGCQSTLQRRWQKEFDIVLVTLAVKAGKSVPAVEDPYIGQCFVFDLNICNAFFLLKYIVNQ